MTENTPTESEPQTAEAHEAPSRRPAHLTILLYLSLFLLVATVSTILSYRLLSFGEETRVPQFVGRSERDAEAMAADRHIQIRVIATVYHPEIPVGFVSEQKISAGSEVKEGQVVPVIVSKGPSLTLIPDFSGKKLEEARFLAVEQGLEVARISYTRHDAVPEGDIAAQNPPPGARGSSFVKLLVSRGPYRTFVDVPDLFGMTQTRAKAELEERGLLLLYTGTGNTVARQTPRPGTRLQRGDSVEVHLLDRQ
ncbi:MAG: PASTA domain-containing protein [Thermodesulfobacteriota bacterium]